MTRMYHALRNCFLPSNKSRRSILPPRTVLMLETLEDRITPDGSFQSDIGLTQVQSAYPYTGSGYTVALLDTGINYNLPSLGGGVGPGYRVTYQYNFVNNTTNALDDNGHGTFLANMIGSSNSSNPGIDPGVQFVDLKVLDSQMNGTWTAIDNALKWVISNQAQYHIEAINLSFGVGNYTSDQFNILEDDFSKLDSMGVFIAVASGNNYALNGSAQGLSYPGVDPDVVSVGATWTGSFGSQTFNGATDTVTAAHELAGFTQRDGSLSILAPGVWVTAIGMDGTPTMMGGTSMSTAVITGSAILIHQALDQTGQSALTSESDILQIMQSTGTVVIDNNPNTNVKDTGLSFKEVNLAAALNSIVKTPSSPTLGTIANQTMQAGQTIAVSLPLNNPAKSPVTFATQLTYLPALAYQLKQQYGLTSSGNYYTDGDGYDEKWIYGSATQSWYWLMPNGDLLLWGGSVAATFQPGNLVASLDPTYYANPTELWQATAVATPAVVFSYTGNTLSIHSPPSWVGTYMVTVAATSGQHTVEQSFQVTATPDTTPPSLSPIANVTQSHGSNLVVSLSGSAADGALVTYAAHVLPVGGQVPALTASVLGNQLTVQPQIPLVGTFTIQVTASDGGLTATRTFTLTLTNTPPTLAAVANQTMAKGQTSLTIPLVASDADNDKLTFQAAVQTPSALAYQLDQQYDFQPSNATYYFNVQGQAEKWLIDKNNQWYALMPNGQLYRWDLTMKLTLTPANFVATLDPSFYANPQLLWEAAPPTTPALTLSFQGNQLVVQRPASLTGIFFIAVTVSDGFSTTQRVIQVTLG